MHDLSKLPKWARERIAKLEDDNASLGRQLAAIAGGPDDTDTYIDGYDVRPNIALPKRAAVTFKIGEEHGDTLQVRVYNYLGRGGIQITGGDWLEIHPSASNVVYIGQVRTK